MNANIDAVRELLASAQALLESPPAEGATWDDRARVASGIARGLDAQGLDGASIIRFGLAHVFVPPILGNVVAAIVLEQQGEPLEEDIAFIDLAGWRRALNGHARPGALAGDLDALVTHASHLIEGWIAYAPFDALVRLTPFEAEQVAEWAASVDADTRTAADIYRWLVDRTLQRGLTQWSLASLKYEYGHRMRGTAPQAPALLLEEPGPDPDQLAHALSDGVLDEEGRRRDAGWVEFMGAVQKQARMLIAQGRSVEAAALFEFLIGRYPSDAGLRNNLAFCLLASRPEEAYECLVEAQRMGYQPTSLLLYNRACCASLEAQKRDVLFEANRHWLDGLEVVPVGAFIWRQSDGGMVAVQSRDVRRDLAEAAQNLAVDLGELDRVPVWEARAAELAGGNGARGA